MCTLTRSLSGFPGGGGEEMQKSTDPIIMVYVRRWLAVPLTTAGRDSKAQAGLYFEGGPHGPAGGRSGWESWWERGVKDDPISGWSNWEDGKILFKDGRTNGKTALEKEVFSPSRVCPSLGHRNNLDLHLVLLLKGRCIWGSHCPTYARPRLFLHGESLGGRQQNGCSLDLGAHLDAAFEKYTHFHSDCVFAQSDLVG